MMIRFNTRYIFIMMCTVLVISMTYNWSKTRLLIRDFAYLTRPIWDKNPKPWKTIPHYYVNGLNGSQLCELHSWHKRVNKLRIIDAIIFSVELDLLEIRLKELWNSVDLFVVLEADKTFTGKQKRLFLNESLKDFQWAQQKLRYELFDGLQELKAGESPFANEANTRNRMNVIMKKYAKTDDLIIVSDVDEIPSSNTIDLLRECQGFPDNMHLQLKTFVYSFEYFYTYDDSWRANIKIYNETAFDYSHGRRSDYLFADSGWHCTFCFRYISDFIFKMTSYSHNDRVTHDILLDKNQIQIKICNGEDVFDMYPEVYTFKELFAKFGAIPKNKILTNLPKHLIENPEKFAFLLPNGCKREDSSDK